MTTNKIPTEAEVKGLLNSAFAATLVAFDALQERLHSLDAASNEATEQIITDLEALRDAWFAANDAADVEGATVVMCEAEEVAWETYKAARDKYTR
tara:strand:+ start:921 stop:1208 length:288 start_codon:yes stop_codon:yes gene_type:complete